MRFGEHDETAEASAFLSPTSGLSTSASSCLSSPYSISASPHSAPNHGQDVWNRTDQCPCPDANHNSQSGTDSLKIVDKNAWERSVNDQVSGRKLGADAGVSLSTSSEGHKLALATQTVGLKIALSPASPPSVTAEVAEAEKCHGHSETASTGLEVAAVGDPPPKSPTSALTESKCPTGTEPDTQPQPAPPTIDHVPVLSSVTSSNAFNPSPKPPRLPDSSSFSADAATGSIFSPKPPRLPDSSSFSLQPQTPKFHDGLLRSGASTPQLGNSASFSHSLSFSYGIGTPRFTDGLLHSGQSSPSHVDPAPHGGAGGAVSVGVGVGVATSTSTSARQSRRGSLEDLSIEAARLFADLAATPRARSNSSTQNPPLSAKRESQPAWVGADDRANGLAQQQGKGATCPAPKPSSNSRRWRLDEVLSPRVDASAVSARLQEIGGPKDSQPLSVESEVSSEALKSHVTVRDPQTSVDPKNISAPGMAISDAKNSPPKNEGTPAANASSEATVEVVHVARRQGFVMLLTPGEKPWKKPRAKNSRQGEGWPTEAKNSPGTEEAPGPKVPTDRSGHSSSGLNIETWQTREGEAQNNQPGAASLGEWPRSDSDSARTVAGRRTRPTAGKKASAGAAGDVATLTTMADPALPQSAVPAVPMAEPERGAKNRPPARSRSESERGAKTGPAAPPRSEPGSVEHLPDEAQDADVDASATDSELSLPRCHGSLRTSCGSFRALARAHGLFLASLGRLGLGDDVTPSSSSNPSLSSSTSSKRSLLPVTSPPPLPVPVPGSLDPKAVSALGVKVGVGAGGWPPPVPSAASWLGFLLGASLVFVSGPLDLSEMLHVVLGHVLLGQMSLWSPSYLLYSLSYLVGLAGSRQSESPDVSYNPFGEALGQDGRLAWYALSGLLPCFLLVLACVHAATGPLSGKQGAGVGIGAAVRRGAVVGVGVAAYLSLARHVFDGVTGRDVTHDLVDLKILLSPADPVGQTRVALVVVAIAMLTPLGVACLALLRRVTSPENLVTDQLCIHRSLCSAVRRSTRRRSGSFRSASSRPPAADRLSDAELDPDDLSGHGVLRGVTSRLRTSFRRLVLGSVSELKRRGAATRGGFVALGELECHDSDSDSGPNSPPRAPPPAAAGQSAVASASASPAPVPASVGRPGGALLGSFTGSGYGSESSFSGGRKQPAGRPPTRALPPRPAARTSLALATSVLQRLSTHAAVADRLLAALDPTESVVAGRVGPDGDAGATTAGDRSSDSDSDLARRRLGDDARDVALGLAWLSATVCRDVTLRRAMVDRPRDVILGHVRGVPTLSEPHLLLRLRGSVLPALLFALFPVQAIVTHVTNVDGIATALPRRFDVDEIASSALIPTFLALVLLSLLVAALSASLYSLRVILDSRRPPFSSLYRKPHPLPLPLPLHTLLSHCFDLSPRLPLGRLLLTVRLVELAATSSCHVATLAYPAATPALLLLALVAQHVSTHVRLRLEFPCVGVTSDPERKLRATFTGLTNQTPELFLERTLTSPKQTRKSMAPVAASVEPEDSLDVMDIV